MILLKCTYSLNRGVPTMSKYIIVIEYGDPNTNEALKTSFGLFDSREEADEFRIATYEDTNHICTILPINKI